MKGSQSQGNRRELSLEGQVVRVSRGGGEVFQTDQKWTGNVSNTEEVDKPRVLTEGPGLGGWGGEDTE